MSIALLGTCMPRDSHFASYARNSRESQAYEASETLLHASHITK
jgi:hypothetical protein